MSASVPLNILLVITDEQPWNAVCNPTLARTPVIDRLATQGCRFGRCFAAHVDASKSRAALLTGQLPSRLAAAGGAAGQTLLPRVLRERGYWCGAFGALDGGAGLLQDAFDDRQMQESDCAQADQVLPADDILNAPAARATVEFLKQRADAGPPFFCVTGMRTAQRPAPAGQFADLYHPAAIAPPAFAGLLEERLGISHEQFMAWESAYLASLSEIDDQVGVILRELERLQLATNTIVVYTAARGRYASQILSDPLMIVPDEAVRVPLIVRGPASVVFSDVRSDAIVEAVDVAPTLLELAGLRAPAAMRGQSLAAALVGAGAKGKEMAIIEMPRKRAARTAHFQYVVGVAGREWLFDLSEPESRMTNVAGDMRYRGTIMQHRLVLLTRMIADADVVRSGC